MNIADVSKKLEFLLTGIEYHVQIAKVGEMLSMRIKNHIGDDIEFCKVGTAYAVSNNEIEMDLTELEFKNIISQYIGNRLMISI